jgi:hypothetical protein
VKGFARCEFFGCGAGAVIGIKLDGFAALVDGTQEQVSLVLHYCATCYETVLANEQRSDGIYTGLREQGCSEKMANHVMLARLERERER